MARLMIGRINRSTKSPRNPIHTSNPAPGLTHPAAQQPWAAAGPAGSLGPTRGLAGGFFDQLRKSFNQEVEKNKEFKESLSKLKVRVCVRVRVWVCMCVCMYGSCRWCPTFRV